MRPNIQERYESLLAKRRVLLQHFDTCSADQFSLKPDPTNGRKPKNK